MTFFTILMACFFAWMFLLIPSIYYLFTAWSTRYDNLSGYFTKDSLQLYYRLFLPSAVERAESDVFKTFRGSFVKYYGRRHYIAPLVSLGLISGIGVFFVANSLFAWADSNWVYKPLPPIALLSFLGAYMWVAFDQIKRFRRRDFATHDVWVCSFRFLIAVPIAYAFAVVLLEPYDIALAFFLGAFPASTLIKFARRSVIKRLDIGEQKGEEQSELEKLQGINRVQAERFYEEGKTSILDLAYADPVDLTIRTNFDFIYIIDCICQALLWIYFEDKVNDLRKLGLRTAYEAKTLWDSIESVDKKAKERAMDSFKEIARVLEVKEKALYEALFEIAEDPHLDLMHKIWATGYPTE